MTTLAPHHSVSMKLPAAQPGQAALEFAIIAGLIITLVFAIVDFGRAFNQMQVMIELTRQGSNLASRGTPLPDSAQAVVTGDAPLDLNSNGEVIITAVTNNSQGNVITAQVSQGAITNASKVGQGIGSLATIPSSAIVMLQPGKTIYITEVFYTYRAITPVAKLVNIVLPSTLYQAAYF
jgi:Flp pilus assembly protein TadG